MMPGNNSPLQIQLVTALVVMVTFVAGAAVGVGVYRRFEHRHAPPPMGLPLRELGLTNEQDAKVRSIMERHRPEVDAIMRESFPRVRAVQEQTEREVRELLTPEQRTHLDELEANRPFFDRDRGPWGEHHHHGEHHGGMGMPDRDGPPPMDGPPHAN